MVVWLLHSWNEYVRPHLHGYSPERFLSLCNAKRSKVWGLIYNRDGSHEFYTTVKGYHHVKPPMRKAQVELRIIGHFGTPSFIYRYRKC